jgi:hypothetical protein
MDFTSHDIAIIEQALHLAISKEMNGSKSQHFREVLLKLQNNAAVVQGVSYLQKGDHEVIRYGYDDSSDLM